MSIIRSFWLDFRENGVLALQGDEHLINTVRKSVDFMNDVSDVEFSFTDIAVHVFGI